MASYKTGTVSVTNGSAEVVGVGTSWGSQMIHAGDIFSLTDTAGAAVSPHYEILTVTDETHLTLSVNYGGVTASGKNYMIWNLTGESTTAYLHTLVAALVQKFKNIITDATSYLTQTLAAKTAAEEARDDAQTAKTAAEAAEQAAENAKSAAQTSATGAANSATTATTAKNDAVTAKNAAESAQTAAQTSATNAAASATNASNSATAAAASVSSVQPGVPGGIATLGADGKVPDAQQTKVYVGNATDAEITALLKPGDMYIR